MTQKVAVRCKCLGVSIYTHIVEVVEDGEAVLGALAVGLRAAGPGEGPGVAAAADGLAAPVLPAQAPLVAAQAPARPEVGRAVSRDLVRGRG